MGEPTNDAPYCFWQRAGGARGAPAGRDPRRGGARRPHRLRRQRRLRAPRPHPGPPRRDARRRAERRAGRRPAHDQPRLAGPRPARPRRVRPGRRCCTNAGPDAADWGKPEAEITHKVEVVDVADRKRAAMRAHASQMGPDHPLLAMPEPMFLRRAGRRVLHRRPRAQPGRRAGACSSTCSRPCGRPWAEPIPPNPRRAFDSVSSYDPRKVRRAASQVRPGGHRDRRRPQADHVAPVPGAPCGQGIHVRSRCAHHGSQGHRDPLPGHVVRASSWSAARWRC